MIFIFAHHYDEEAKWLVQHLQHQNNTEAKLVVAEALGIDYDACLSIKNTGTEAVIWFNEDTGCKAYNNCTLVINRLLYITPIVWNKSEDKEKMYATNEINSFFAAFIHAYTCPVINPVEHGSILGNRTGSLKIIKTITENGINIHPYVFEENYKAFKLIEANAANCLRVMRWGDKTFFPANQLHNIFKNLLTNLLQPLALTSTYELFFIEMGAGFQLINISRSPSLSVYGAPFVQYISGTLNIPQPCY